ncbi:MAG: iron-containing alcohol dehydrogenase [Candidatus Omnitrophica bacterium]|nr:iron-containing alcohol dehydrogenase [Candidatus Omnitrophota bacterium]
MMNTLPNTQFSIPTTVRFGAGEIKKIRTFLDLVGSKNPLLMTDPGMVNTPAFKKILAPLRDGSSDYGLFGDVLPNPTEDNIDDATNQYLGNGHDCVIGFGGGSALDAAKAVALRATYGGSLEGYSSDLVPRGTLPKIIAVPTTAGTGSEVGRASVIVLRSTGKKAILLHPDLMPAIAVIDPELTVDLPPHLTAATGMDAFTHCLESLTSPEFHPVCDAIAVGGLELTIKNLPVAYRDGKNLEARGYMMIAAMMGALAFQKDLGAAHSMAHPLSTISGLHHGLANAIVLPTVMEFNREVAERHYAKLAHLFNKENVLKPDEEASRIAIERVRELNKDLGIPSSLKEAGVPESDLGPLAKQAIADPCHATNARPCTLEDFQKLFSQAYSG